MSEDDYYYVEDEQPQQMDPRLEGMLNAYEQAAAESTYEQEMQRVTTMNPDVNPDALHPFVAAADGDFNTAVQMYGNFMNQFAEPAGDEAPSHADRPADGPTPTLGEAVRDFTAQFTR